MRIFFAGDIVGRPGMQATVALIPLLRAELGLDAVIVNCENAAPGGRGITPQLARSLFAAGVDVLTGGNHIFHLPELGPYLEAEPRLIRPANYDQRPGRGAYKLRLTNNRTLGVVQVLGRVFMPGKASCPFVAASRELDALGPVTASLLDVHAETSSEKQGLAWHFAGRVSAVIGTHTHVPTADARILADHTAYLTDAGMSGPYASVIGMDTDCAIERLRTGERGEHEVARNDVRVCGAVIDICDKTGRALHIETLQAPWPRA